MPQIAVTEKDAPQIPLNERLGPAAFILRLTNKKQ
jgi:hypothetical protein